MKALAVHRLIPAAQAERQAMNMAPVCQREWARCLSQADSALADLKASVWMTVGELVKAIARKWQS
jgi:hypothetical protein